MNDNQNVPRPLVGVGIMIMKDGKVLLGLRKNAHGAGEYAFPGGHLEHGESFEECIRREIAEECGLEVKDVRFQFVANVMLYAPKHYVHIGLIADWAGGEPQTLEPEKCAGWDWYSPDKLPSPMFAMARLAFESRATGQVCFDPVKD